MNRHQGALPLFLPPANRYSATASNDPLTRRSDIPAPTLRNAMTDRPGESLALQIMHAAIRAAHR